MAVSTHFECAEAGAKPRLQPSRSDRVVLEENMWELAKDLGLLRDRIAELSADRFPPGAVVLDPLIGHF